MKFNSQALVKLGILALLTATGASPTAAKPTRHFFCASSVSGDSPIYFSEFYTSTAIDIWTDDTKFEKFVVEGAGLDPSDPPSMTCKGFDSQSEAKEAREDRKRGVRERGLKIVQTNWVYRGLSDLQYKASIE